MKDGEVIFEYMKNVMNIKKIGVHGESIGGLIATNIAKKKRVDLLVADRTFSSISNVVYYGFHILLYGLFSFFANWNSSNSSPYIDANCYKIILFDARDELVTPMSSLKNGITKEIIRRKIHKDCEYF